MYATTPASESLHTCRSARPRPFASRWTTRTSSNSSARERASANVPSTLALSAMVIRAENGTCVRKCRAQAPHARLEACLFVVYRDDHVQHYSRRGDLLCVRAARGLHGFCRLCVLDLSGRLRRTCVQPGSFLATGRGLISGYAFSLQCHHQRGSTRTFRVGGRGRRRVLDHCAR